MSDENTELDEDKLRDALAAAANATVKTVYGDVPLGAALQSPDPELNGPASTRLFELGNGLLPFLVDDSRFPGTSRLFLRSQIGPLPLYPDQCTGQLIRRAIDTGSPEEAIQWLESVLATKDGPCRIIEAVWGVSVEAEVQLTDAIRIVPIEQLPDSPQKRLLTGSSSSTADSLLSSMLDFAMTKSALVAQHTIQNVICTEERGLALIASEREKPPIFLFEELLADVTLALTLVGPRVPISAMAWFEFDDQDLQYMASITVGRRTRGIEILPSDRRDYPTLNAEEAKEAKEVVDQYLNLAPDLKSKIHVALHRLNIAQRRASLGDKAVEVCIALESLLGGSDKQEVTHKVTTRAARLLGGTDQDRVRNRDVVNFTYGFRSAMVHEGAEPKGTKKVAGEDTPVAEIIEAVVTICVDVIKSIMRKGKIPDWKLFDIQVDSIPDKSSMNSGGQNGVDPAAAGSRLTGESSRSPEVPQ